MSLKANFPLCKECLKSAKHHKFHSQIKNRHFSTDEEQRHQLALEQEENAIDQNLASINFLVKSASKTVYDHFENVRNEINLRREILLKQVHNKSNELIKRSNLREESVIKKLNEKITESKIEFERENKRLIEVFRSEKLDLMQIEEFKRRNVNRLNEIESFLLGMDLTRDSSFKSVPNENKNLSMINSINDKVMIRKILHWLVKTF